LEERIAAAIAAAITKHVSTNAETITIGDRVRVEWTTNKPDLLGDVVYLPQAIGDAWIIKSDDRIFYIQQYAAISKRVAGESSNAE
jgi:hypothetical protein